MTAWSAVRPSLEAIDKAAATARWTSDACMTGLSTEAAGRWSGRRTSPHGYHVFAVEVRYRLAGGQDDRQQPDSQQQQCC